MKWKKILKDRLYFPHSTKSACFERNSLSCIFILILLSFSYFVLFFMSFSLSRSHYCRVSHPSSSFSLWFSSFSILFSLVFLLFLSNHSCFSLFLSFILFFLSNHSGFSSLLCSSLSLFSLVFLHFLSFSSYSLCHVALRLSF